MAGDNNGLYGPNGKPSVPFSLMLSASSSVESTALSSQNGHAHRRPGQRGNPLGGRTSTMGSAFEFIRNKTYIDATNFFSTSPDKLHPESVRRQPSADQILRDKLLCLRRIPALTHKTQSQASVKGQVPTAANLAGRLVSLRVANLYLQDQARFNCLTL